MHPERQNQPSPASPSGAAGGPSMTTSAQLVGSTGADRPATTGDVAERLQAGGFFWLDLENPDENELAEFCQSLQLSGAAVETLTHASQRSSFARAAGSVQAVLPASVDTRRRGTWLEANYVTLVLTEQFLLTVHASPCAPLQQARNQYCRLDDEHTRTDGVRLLFLVADELIGSFRPQLLAIDDRLGEIQLGMLRSVSQGVHNELVKILGVLTETIQELGWYATTLKTSLRWWTGCPACAPARSSISTITASA